MWPGLCQYDLHFRFTDYFPDEAPTSTTQKLGWKPYKNGISVLHFLLLETVFCSERKTHFSTARLDQRPEVFNLNAPVQL